MHHEQSEDSSRDGQAPAVASRAKRPQDVFNRGAAGAFEEGDAGAGGAGLVIAEDANVALDAAELGARLVDRGPDLMMLVSPQGVVVGANAVCGRVLGVPTGELLGLRWVDLLHESDSEDVPDDPRELSTWRQFAEYPWEVRLRSARDHWQLVSGAAVDLVDDPAVGAVLLALRPLGAPGEVMASRALLLQAVDAANSSIVIADARQDDFPLVYVNQGFLDLTGYDRGEILGHNCRFLQFVGGGQSPEDGGPAIGDRDDGDDAAINDDARDDAADHDQAGALATIRDGVRGREQVHAVLRNYRKDGTRFFNDLYLTPVVKNGQYLGVIGVQNDVSDRVRAEAELRHSERTLRGFFDAAPMLMGLVELGDDDGGPPRHVMISAAGCEMLGCDPCCGEGTTLADLGLDEDEARRWRSAMRRAAETGETQRFQGAVARDGGRRNLRVSVSPVETGAGERHRVCYVAEDTTVGDKAEADRHLLEAAIENSSESAVITTPDLDPPGPRMLYVNAAFERMTGWHRDEVIGQSPRILQGPKTDRNVLDRLRRDLEEKRHFRGESVNYRKDGSEFDIDWSIAPILDAAGDVVYWVAAQRDVSRRRELERQVLTIQQREQERIARDLHDTVAQQLNALTLYVGSVAGELEQSGIADAEQVQMLRDAVQQAREAAETSRNISHSLMPVDLGDRGLMEALGRLAERSQKAYGVRCGFACDRPFLVENHERASHLYRVATEAVGNALRHGRPSRVSISLAADGDGRTATLRVADDGRGMSARAASTGGGLGMNTMRYRAELIGGSIAVTPGDDGRGTVVACRFPHAHDAE